jgi:hypothetical protein
VLLDVPGAGETRLPLGAIHSAKLVLTDRLIAATAPLSTDGADEVSYDNGPDRPHPNPSPEGEGLKEGQD